MSTKLYTIDFEPIGKRIVVPQGSSILDAARSAGIDLVAVCGGAGTCRQCQVQIIQGHIGLPNSIERKAFSESLLKDGWRLACQSEIQDSMKVHIPSDSLTTPQRLQVEGIAEELTTPSRFEVIEVSQQDGNPYHIDSQKSNRKRIYVDGSIQFDPGQKELQAAFEKALSINGKLRLILHQEKILNYVSQNEHFYGLAVDLGSTKIAAFLLDLESNNVVAKASAMNPQIQYGEDIISRILYCMEHQDGQELMQRIVIESLNQLISQMVREVKARPDQIIEAALVGNTAMHHLFARLPVEQLGLSPFTPAMLDSTEISANKIGLMISPFAKVYLPENIAGYVGGDHVAMMLGTGADSQKDTVMAIDIGTNTEISLVHNGQIYTCSCASGPAFEGAHITEGMRAAEGAIEHIRIERETIQYQTIGNMPPIGICGSGILEAIAELYRNHLLDKRGNFTSKQNTEANGHVKEYELVPAEKSGCNRAIVITKKDVNEILLAKAAIQTGIEILLRTAGIHANELDEIIIAGAFGTYLSITSAIQIGMFPDLPISRYKQVGNAAGTGARLLLLSDEYRTKGKELARRSNYVELTLYPEFQKIYLNALRFPDLDEPN